ncbi:EamA family transporter [Isoptericola halotolerans]|uniref:Drug/metabolite transporter (DMT)-like permease n=1 Tax=Isoptericola halotolerans TaxID=300560 RepID=A0ABX2A7S7_9MICO|nr:DMT family transporter [Isoptericola halotolerans]NOV98839.1 drug/metabolite transporter (DMT)-like permease [Isoptericola halotolerans]
MRSVTPDAVRSRSTATRIGLLLAVVSALAFSLSGPLAGALFETGWSPGAVVIVRMAVGALVVLPLGIRALHGRWDVVRRNARMIVAYGLLGVAATQFCFFVAVQHMQVGPALLVEYSAPAAVVVWLWLRRGQRPTRATLGGVALALVGLLLVLDLTGARVSLVGTAWALGAMIGASAYFLLNARADTGLPPLSLAAGGLTVGTLSLGALAAVGLLPMSASTAPVTLGGATLPWWSALAVLGVVAAGVAYVTGIAAGRRLGARASSFMGLLEVLSAVLLAWALLGQLPSPVQLTGGALVLAGVVVVQQGEAAAARRTTNTLAASARRRR